MQITIDIPDNLPKNILQQHIHKFEEMLKQQVNILGTKISEKEEKYQQIMKIAKKCSSLETIDHRSSDEILGYNDSKNKTQSLNYF